MATKFCWFLCMGVTTQLVSGAAGRAKVGLCYASSCVNYVFDCV